MSNQKNLEEQMEEYYPDLSDENEIIKNIINNSLLDKIEDLEEEEEYENDKDKIFDEISENKIPFIINNEKQNSIQIYNDIIENLLIELFDYHYSEISKEKKLNLTNKILELKYNIEYFCVDSLNLSKNVLYFLEVKIYELIEYVIKKMEEIKIVSFEDILKIKNCLKSTGEDISKIFEKTFQKTKNFDISSILIILFISNIIKYYSDKITEEEYDQIMDISIDEKDRFENYIKECKSSLDEEIEEIEIENIEEEEEEKKEKDDEEEKVKEEKEEEEKEKEVKEIKELKEEKEEEKEKEEKDVRIMEEEKQNENKKYIIDNLETNIINNNIKEEKVDDDNCIDSSVNKNEINISKKDNNYVNEKNEDNNNTQNFVNLEDLIKYINGNNNKKKKKKKRKKKKKIKVEEEIDNKIIEKDIVFENFKSNLINYTNNLRKVKKVKPKISKDFLEKLKNMI